MLANFEKTLVSLDEASKLERNSVVRDATIQRFEFCVELAWKTSKKFMATQTSAPRQVIREMAQAGLIDDIDFWFKALENRNLSLHTYNEPLAEQVYMFALSFLSPAQILLEKLKKL